jgi:pantetheine-phosphate adenylyltransferase
MANKVRRAIFPGSFDPITNGHLDVLKHALKVFPEVVVLVANNVLKNPLFSAEERIQLISAATKGMVGVSVVGFDGLVVDFAKKVKAVALIRGLRATGDFESEMQMALMNRHLLPDLETVFFLSTEDSSFISSSMIRQVASMGGDVSSLVPKSVGLALSKKFKGKA